MQLNTVALSRPDSELNILVLFIRILFYEEKKTSLSETGKLFRIRVLFRQSA